ncbi:COX6A-domain-containing protein [Cucurbitaria berberidis CBS 394.84]|uniref:Cytochrome c oxidase subunit n=1 Tax=Cucurbitaria berberidis CBS 394.84 TaxID=1168544 RepID=A0A9P4G967_9PLEO|nr:COX6A-domain-containing protein [Cucurbitaria berberidis CBS 394.84]KAF1841443.1 COX6A-domain-containing protein [Cucurbitaria berberidis CBS 394.84]
MFAQRILARSTPRMALARAPLRASRRNYSSETKQQFVGAEDNEFNRERARIAEHGAESGEFWRKLSLYVAVPCLIIASVNAKLRWDAHWEHVAHDTPREDKPEYAYQNIRTKNFWWGDGDKTLFWNDKVNYHKKDE